MTNKQSKDIVQELTSRQPVQSLAAQQVMKYLSSLMGTVRIDTATLAKELEESLIDDSQDDRGGLRKMASILTKFFGLTLVSRRDCLKISTSALGDEDGTQLLQVNQRKAADLIAAIASVVEDCEKSKDAAIKRLSQMEGTLSTITREADSAKREQDSMRKAQDRKDRDILKAVQRILAQRPEMKPAQEGEKDALLLFLEDMELTWSWNAEDAPDDFTTYVITDPSQTGVRMPCIYQNGEVAVKGLRYSLGT